MQWPLKVEDRQVRFHSNPLFSLSSCDVTDSLDSLPWASTNVFLSSTEPSEIRSIVLSEHCSSHNWVLHNCGQQKEGLSRKIAQFKNFNIQITYEIDQLKETKALFNNWLIWLCQKEKVLHVSSLCCLKILFKQPCRTNIWMIFPSLHSIYERAEVPANSHASQILNDIIET